MQVDATKATSHTTLSKDRTQDMAREDVGRRRRTSPRELRRWNPIGTNRLRRKGSSAS